MVPQLSPFAFIASVTFAASVFAAPFSEPLDSGIVVDTFSHATRAISYWNDHHEEYGLDTGETLETRAVVIDRVLKPQLDAAMDRTANLKHFFWTGWTLPGSWKKSSVQNRAGKLAKKMGGITLEETIKDIKMPDFKQRDKKSNDTWEYASAEFAAHAKGDAYLIQGDETRPNNVWISFEFDRLKKNPNVPRIWRIDMHVYGKTDPQVQIWPECADFEDRALTCPSDAKLYRGAATKPRVSSRTTVARDGRAVVIQRGSASTIRRECNQIIDGKMVKDLMQKAGACTGDSKINGQIKALLSSAKNRQYVQKARIFPMAKDLKSDLVNARKFTSSPLDGLVAIDYYERTLTDSRSVARQIDTLLKTATGTSPGVATAWDTKIRKMKGIKTTLLARVRQQMVAQRKQATANQQRNAACRGPRAFATPSRRMERRFSPLPLTSLEARVVKAPLSGAKAPAAPACPLKSAPAKKTVARSKVATKAPPAKQPRVPAKAPARKPVNTKKKVAPRPANRARRTPGKAAPRKRTAPKRKPKVVPKPTRRPKGKPRSRKRKGRK